VGEAKIASHGFVILDLCLLLGAKIWEAKLWVKPFRAEPKYEAWQNCNRSQWI